MNIEAFKSAYGMSRNGCDGYIRHPLVRNFIFTDGVRDCAEAGCYWLLDIIATEGVQAFRPHRDDAMAFFIVKVNDGAAVIRLEVQDDVPPAWTRDVDFTDMPDGEWKFFMSWDGEQYIFILPTEY